MRGEMVLRALDACYDAVSTPELWQPALNDLAASLDSACAMFYPKDVNENATIVPSSTHYADLLEDYVANGWYENHYRAERGWPILERQSTTVLVEHDLSTEEERRKLAHYNDFYLKWGYPGFAAIGFRVGEERWCLPLLRSVRQGHFSREEARNLALLAPDLRRMMHLSEEFAKARASSGRDALARIDRAAILIDNLGRVVDMNERAETLLARSAEWLGIREGRLRASHCGSNDGLQALLSTAGHYGHRRQRAIEAAGPIRIERPRGRALLVEMVSLRDLVTIVSSTAFAILLLTDPDDKPDADAERLRLALRLTPAESRLAAALLRGDSLEQASTSLGITTGTAGQRVKAMFVKTDTHRQGELVALLARVMR